jgi:hypothetical protein
MGAAIIAYAAFAWWSASHFVDRPQQAAMAATRPIGVVPRPVLMAIASKPVVPFVNPFNTTEVFEFPAGTSPAERREKVAQILLQRARGWQSRWEHIKPAVSLHAANVHQVP